MEISLRFILSLHLTFLPVHSSGSDQDKDLQESVLGKVKFEKFLSYWPEIFRMDLENEAKYLCVAGKTLRVSPRISTTMAPQ